MTHHVNHLSATQPQGLIFSSRVDQRLLADQYNDVNVEWCMLDEGFIDGYWPRRGGTVGDNGLDISMLEATRGFEDISRFNGTRPSFSFAGVTRDQYGSPVGGCTVVLFRSADHLLICSAVSDAAGNFTLASPFYPDQHYVVSHKAGSPNIAGASANTLIGI